MMATTLDEISRNVAEGHHAVLLLRTRPGYHDEQADVPGNIKTISLNRTPELNPVENVWRFIHWN